MYPETTPAAKQGDRWTVIRDMLVFQFKLVIDGILDLVLLPVSLVVGVVSFVRGGSGHEFYELLRLGRRGERWINLFGAAGRKSGPPQEAVEPAARDLDDLVSQVESFVLQECRKRGATAQTKQRLDAAIDSLHNLSKQRSRSEPK